MKFFLHRILISGNTVQNGIKVHVTLDSTVLSYQGRDKTGYGRSESNFAHCFISDENSPVSNEYDSVWSDGSEMGFRFQFFENLLSLWIPNYRQLIKVLRNCREALLSSLTGIPFRQPCLLAVMLISKTTPMGPAKSYTTMPLFRHFV